MKLILRALVFALTIVSLYAGNYLDRQIYVKFNEKSPIFKNWESNHRQGEIKELKSILGDNISKPFLDDKFKKAFDNYNKKNQATLLSSNQEFNFFAVAVIKYSGAIPSEIAAKKLKSFDFIEFAEAIPEMKFCYTPNDTFYSGQYYLRKIQADKAWDISDSNSKVLVGIVDTGVDYDHEDLSGNIYANPGETGLDSNGVDKRYNGKDDDGNGFIDDWRGWDFVSSDTTGQDNDPMPGNNHGTHVAGIVAAVTNNTLGVAGTANNAKILSVKCASDDPNTRSVTEGYQGILYAGLAGAKIINCSWGGGGNTIIEENILKKIESMGALLVAAAGNDGMETSFYPASYPGSLSVAAVDSVDFKAYFSNYHGSIGIAAPGVGILSTLPGNFYMEFDGTSMASPVVAGVAAMARAAFPDDSPLQLKERLKANSDNIDWANPSKYGKLGSGRVNAYKTLANKNPLAISVSNKQIIEQIPDLAYDPDENIQIAVQVTNYLGNAESCYAKIRCSDKNLNFKPDSIFIGKLETGQTKELDKKFSFNVPVDYDPDTRKDFIIEIYSDTNKISRYVFKLTFNPSFRNFTENDVATTINSKGSIGYNDYSTNEQGLGFIYKNTANMLFEGALIIGDRYDRVFDCARNGSNKNRDLQTDTVLIKKVPGKIAKAEGVCSFYDVPVEFTPVFKINQKIYQFNDNDVKNAVYLVYDVVNNTEFKMDSLCLSLFFDWDIGNSSADSCYFDFNRNLGIVKNVKTDTLPCAGVAFLSKQNVSFFAVDNDGASPDNPGIYSDFSKAKKWKMISSGFGRMNSNVTDVSLVIGGGPQILANGDTTRYVFALMGGENPEVIQNSYNAVAKKGKTLFVNSVNYTTLVTNDIKKISPNPASKDIIIDYYLIENENPIFNIYDELGGLVLTKQEGDIPAGNRKINIPVDIYASGKYIVEMKTKRNSVKQGLIIAK